MKIINLPPGIQLDEFLVKHGKAAFNKLIEAAEDCGARLAMKTRISDIRRQKAATFEKNAQVSQAVIADFNQNGSFLKTSLEPYYFSREDFRVYSFKNDVCFRSFVNERYGINASEPVWEYLVEQLTVEAVQRGVETEIKKFCYYDRSNHKLYISNFAGGVYLLNGQEVTLVPNGTDGVLFKDSDLWEPYTYLGKKSDSSLMERLLIRPINFDATGMCGLTVKDFRILWKIYIYSLFFKDLLLSRPLVAYVGEKGAGKSTAIRFVMRLLFGAKVRLHTLSKKKEDAFLALVTDQFFVGLDNVDDPVDWLNDHLAALATGAGVSLRDLYTTNSLVTYTVDVFICLTSRTPRFNRDDVADRMLFFPVARIEDFISDEELDRKILTSRDRLWTSMLNDLNAMVGNFKRHYEIRRSSSRLADFNQLGANIAAHFGKPKTFKRIMDTLSMGQSLFVLQDDPLFHLLELWLDKKGNSGRRLLALQLHSELANLAFLKDIKWTYPTPRGLAKRLNNILPNLRQFFDVSTDVKGGNRRYYVFKHKDQG